MNSEVLRIHHEIQKLKSQGFDFLADQMAKALLTDSPGNTEPGEASQGGATATPLSCRPVSLFQEAA